MALDSVSPQPAPTSSSRSVEVTPLVVADLEARAKMGRVKYGRPLESFNGRNALIDAYQEALDFCLYLRQAIEEATADTSPRLPFP